MRNRDVIQTGRAKVKRINLGTHIFCSILLTVLIIAVIGAIIITIDSPLKYSVMDIVLFTSVSNVALISLIYLHFISGRDTLTGIPNQEYFTLFCLFKQIRKKFPLYTSIYFNVKDFKYVNRIVGNNGGDVALMRIARFMKEFIVKGECVARLGGDNFIALVYKHRADDFIELINSIEVELSDGDNNYKFDISSRCGLYALSDNDKVGDVFNNPSIAYNYSRQNNGAAITWFSKKMADKLYEEKGISYEFNNAVKNGDFLVYFQPKVNIDTNLLYGCEALVRWKRNGKIVLPKDFIPALERNHLIEKLDFLVLSEVCRYYKAWKDKGLNLVPVSVNFTKIHLHDRNFSQKIIEIINKYQIERSLFEIELTESENFDDIETLQKFLGDMHSANIDVAIDDFGMGYSSLELLKNFNVDAIKLDKSFIDDIERNGGENTDALLVRNVVHTCHDLKKDIVCEGIENTMQRDIVAGMRCNIIQGYLYDEPLSAEEFEDRLRNPDYAVRIQ